jgi:hypothetical protein
MPVLTKTYQVISPRAVMVEHAGGNAVNHPPGERFVASPTDRSIVRLLRMNAIREVSLREIPNFDLTKPKADASGSQN